MMQGTIRIYAPVYRRPTLRPIAINMTDRITQLQTAVNDAVNQYHSALNYLHTQHQPSSLSGEGLIAEHLGETPAAPAQEVEKIGDAKRELARDMIVKHKQIDALIDSLPGVGVTEGEQYARLRLLEGELQRIDQEYAQLLGDKDVLQNKLDDLIPKQRAPSNPCFPCAQPLLKLLLGAELGGVTTSLLAAVGGTGRETGVALAADHLVAVVLGSQSLKRGLNDTTTETEDKVKGRLLLDVVVGESAAILELLSGEDETLLVRGNSLLVLDLGLDVVDGVRGLDLEGDGLTREGLDEDLHLYRGRRVSSVTSRQRRERTTYLCCGGESKLSGRPSDRSACQFAARGGRATRGGEGFCASSPGSHFGWCLCLCLAVLPVPVIVHTTITSSIHPQHTQHNETTSIHPQHNETTSIHPQHIQHNETNGSTHDEGSRLPGCASRHARLGHKLRIQRRCFPWIPPLVNADQPFQAYAPQLADRLRLTATQSNIIGAFGNYGVYFGGPFVGMLVDARGPRLPLLLAAGVLFSGYYGLYRAYTYNYETSVTTLALCMLLTGVGSSAGSAAAINSVVKNFPTTRGTATSIAISLFGLSAFAFSAAAAFLGDTSAFLLLLSTATGVSCLIGAYFVVIVPPMAIDYLTVSESRPSLHDRRRPILRQEPDMGGVSLLKSTEFWLFFTVVCFLSGAGLMLINNVGHCVQSLWSVNHPNASPGHVRQMQASHVGTISIFNCLGRISAGVTSDVARRKWGLQRCWFLCIAAGLFVVAQFAASIITHAQNLYVVSSMTGFAYGMMFGTAPVLLAEWFGVARFSQNWGWLCVGPGIAGSIFNLLYGRTYDSHVSGDQECRLGLECYQAAFQVTGTACCAALALAIALGIRVRNRN
ncbi:hypothetical protein G7K_0171-t1 [Saitoella complicata NRRL Y-17804]|uniref:Mediator of RNA polymerase II transcription subunit 21 n=1 Tax=Saitoella complicata (strain BCRC 22490 / CBS 7301 / JCM 7358 / NBRC 10748 / NRRL Y-17804) TaxID=698492 RepID=A0A0E9N955_SAICN|nr:hypothetical protein G7K_0171-t1 [Saitoella complicata NRRL Y-17804]